MHGSKPPLTRIFKNNLHKKGEVIPQHFRFNFDYLKNEKRFEIIHVR